MRCKVASIFADLYQTAGAFFARQNILDTWIAVKTLDLLDWFVELFCNSGCKLDCNNQSRRMIT